VKLHVQSAGVADGLSLCISPPQCGCTGVAVSAAKTCSSRRALLQRKIVEKAVKLADIERILQSSSLKERGNERKIHVLAYVHLVVHVVIQIFCC